MVWHSLVMLGSGSEPQLPPSHVIQRANNRQAAVASSFWILCLCFHIMSTKRPSVSSSGEKRREAMTWDETQDNCATGGKSRCSEPAEGRQAGLSWHVQWIRCIKRICSLQYFQLMKDLSGSNPIASGGPSVCGNKPIYQSYWAKYLPFLLYETFV